MSLDEPDLLNICVLQDKIENTDICLNSEEWFFCLKYATKITWKFEGKQLILKRNSRGIWSTKLKSLSNF